LLKYVITPIHPAGWPFVGIAVAIALVLGLISSLLLWLGIALILFCLYFFRDPVRVTPQRQGLVVSPADGVVTAIERAPPPPELGLEAHPLTRISVFLSVLDVHVNRVPADGSVMASAYHPGRFFNAALDKASEHNERQSVSLKTSDGRIIVFVQIAGLIARRIICDLKEGQDVRAGERFGLIRFGSRTDVFLPDGASPLVTVGQRAVGGETVLADLAASEGPREAEER
jgi:phosphatidylserine decarboxylase